MSWPPPGNVVVPVDFSDRSLDALDEALRLTEDPSRLHVVHVLEDVSSYEPEFIWETVSHEERMREAEQALKEWLDDPVYSGIHLHVVLGNPGYEITELAKQLDAALIVISSHGRTGLSHLLLGSVAERVLRLAHCPVLVIRGG